MEDQSNLYRVRTRGLKEVFFLPYTPQSRILFRLNNRRWTLFCDNWVWAVVQALRCCCRRQAGSLPDTFGERSVTLLVGLALLSCNRHSPGLCSCACVDSWILLRKVSDFSNG